MPGYFDPNVAYRLAMNHLLQPMVHPLDEFFCWDLSRPSHHHSFDLDRGEHGRQSGPDRSSGVVHGARDGGITALRQLLQALERDAAVNGFKNTQDGW